MTYQTREEIRIAAKAVEVAYRDIPALPNHTLEQKRGRDAAIKRFRRRAEKMVAILEGLLLRAELCKLVKIRIDVQGGVAYVVEKPVGVEVEIRDYDCYGCGIFEETTTDEEGYPYIESFWRKDEETHGD